MKWNRMGRVFCPQSGKMELWNGGKADPKADIAARQCVKCGTRHGEDVR